MEFRLCHPLCFLVNKCGKLQENVLNSILIEFYSAEEVSVARRLLLRDVEMVKDVSFQQYTRNNNNVEHDVNDMIGILTTLAENNVLSQLPTYVSDNPDKLPYVNSGGNEFNSLLVMMKGFEARLDSFGTAMAAIAQDVVEIRREFITPKTSKPHEVQSGVKPRSMPNPPTGGLIDKSNDWPLLNVNTPGNSNRTSTSADAQMQSSQAYDWVTLTSTPLNFCQRKSFRSIGGRRRRERWCRFSRATLRSNQASS